MTERDHRSTLKRTPNTRALWDRMELLNQEFPGHVLMKNTPFLLSNSLELVDSPMDDVMLASLRWAQNRAILWVELSMIEDMLHQRVFKKKELKRLERRSAFIHETIETISLNAAAREVRHMRATKQLFN